MAAINFVNYRKHFALHSRPIIQRPILLFMDNYESHVTLEAIQFWGEHGIVALELQISQQPLIPALGQGRGQELYSNLQSTLCIIIIHIQKIVGNAFFKETVNAFKATEIKPFDISIFRDEDFQPPVTTDIQTIELTAPAFEYRPESSFDNLNPEILSTQNDSSANQYSTSTQLQLMISQTLSQSMDSISSTSLALLTLPVASKNTV